MDQSPAKSNFYFCLKYGNTFEKCHYRNVRDTFWECEWRKFSHYLSRSLSPRVRLGQISLQLSRNIQNPEHHKKQLLDFSHCNFPLIFDLLYDFEKRISMITCPRLNISELLKIHILKLARIRKLINFFQRFLQRYTSPDGIIPAGQHSLPFSFSIPDHCPPTLELDLKKIKASVSYYLIAKIHRINPVDLKSKRTEFRVMANESSRGMAGILRSPGRGLEYPMTQKVTAKLGTCCYHDGTLRASVGGHFLLEFGKYAFSKTVFRNICFGMTNGNDL